MLLRWQNLLIGYEDALNHPASGEITAAGIFAVVGANGSGKSTFLKTLIGLRRPLQGTIDVVVDHVHHPRPFHVHLGYVPQSHRINRHIPITVRDLVMQGFGPNQVTINDEKTYLQQALQEWELDPVSSRSFHELSLGQQVRTLCARAMVAAPEFLFLDEPLASLDTTGQKFLIQKLVQLKERDRVCIIMIDHHLRAYYELLDGMIHFERSPDSHLARIQQEALS